MCWRCVESFHMCPGGTLRVDHRASPCFLGAPPEFTLCSHSCPLTITNMHYTTSPSTPCGSAASTASQNQSRKTASSLFPQNEVAAEQDYFFGRNENDDEHYDDDRLENYNQSRECEGDAAALEEFAASLVSLACAVSYSTCFTDLLPTAAPTLRSHAVYLHKPVYGAVHCLESPRAVLPPRYHNSHRRVAALHSRRARRVQ